MISLICAAVLTGATATVPSIPASASGAVMLQRILGGYSSVSVDDAGVRSAAAFAAASVDGELGEVISAERQSAAGSNYKIEFLTSDGRTYSAVVRRDLSGAHSVTSIVDSGTGDRQEEAAAEQSEAGEDE